MIFPSFFNQGITYLQIAFNSHFIFPHRLPTPVNQYIGETMIRSFEINFINYSFKLLFNESLASLNNG